MAIDLSTYDIMADMAPIVRQVGQAAPGPVAVAMVDGFPSAEIVGDEYDIEDQTRDGRSDAIRADDAGWRPVR